MVSDTKLPAVCWEVLFNRSDKIQALVIEVAPANTGLMLWLTVISGEKNNPTRKPKPPLWPISPGKQKEKGDYSYQLHSGTGTV